MMSIRSNIARAMFLILSAGSSGYAQDAPDPHAAQPERPTVATHAWTVAPGYAELETGVEWDHNPDSSFGVSTPTVLKLGVGRRAQLGVFGGLNAGTGVSLGAGDAGVVLKYRFADDLPVLGAFAVLPGIKFPAGRGDRGTHTTDGSILLISSHKLGAVALDINVGYTRRSGTGIFAPRNATVWTVSTGGPLAGAVGFAAEVFGFPGTSGPAGGAGSIAILAGPVFALKPWAVMDTGVIIRLHGDQPHAIYGGLVYNFGSFVH
jgi:hypothetical protein